LRFQVLADRDYQRSCIAPIEKELESRGHSIYFSKRTPSPKNDVDATIIPSVKYLSKGIIEHLKRPIFHVAHSVAVIKTVLYPLHTMSDHMLMPGPMWHERMEYLFPKYKNNIPAGYPKCDELVLAKKQPGYISKIRQEVISELGLDPKEPIIVFAPSWDDPEALRKGTIDALPQVEALGFKNLIVCPHDYDKMFNKLEGTKIIKKPNKNRYLMAADLLIGDISGIMIEFALLDKPMVQIDMTGNRHHYGIWEDNPNHYGTFQIGEFASPDTLPQAVKAALDHPDKYKFLREYWIWRSFYNLGSASKVTADKVIELTSSYSPVKKRSFFFF
jgi:hypothetical protein